MTWHVLDIGSIWLKEFASALSEHVQVLGWLPRMGWTGFLHTNSELERHIAEPPLRIREFPLQRGYHQFPLSVISQLGKRQAGRMARQSAKPEESPLVCTTPFYAPVAERWPGPIIYYQTDLTFAYAGIDGKQVRQLDRRLCRVASVVCPNSRRVADYMVAEAGCDPHKIEVVPNATRASNLLNAPPLAPGALPQDLKDLPRPVVGVLGNLAGNLNWRLLREAIDRTPQFSWAFVGPTEMEILEPDQREARKQLLSRGGNVRFVGSKAYGQLQEYARALDVAILPYRRKEPTFSGSSTRFYEHLSACRPMIATRGFEELLRKEPLLTLVDTAAEMVVALEALAKVNFSDGFERMRWEASQQGTWQARAAMVVSALQKRWKAPLQISKPFSPVPVEMPYSEDLNRRPLTEFNLVSPD